MHAPAQRHTPPDMHDPPLFPPLTPPNPSTLACRGRGSGAVLPAWMTGGGGGPGSGGGAPAAAPPSGGGGGLGLGEGLEHIQSVEQALAILEAHAKVRGPATNEATPWVGSSAAAHSTTAHPTRCPCALLCLPAVEKGEEEEAQEGEEEQEGQEREGGWSHHSMARHNNFQPPQCACNSAVDRAGQAVLACCCTADCHVPAHPCAKRFPVCIPACCRRKKRRRGASGAAARRRAAAGPAATATETLADDLPDSRACHVPLHAPVCLWVHFPPFTWLRPGSP